MVPLRYGELFVGRCVEALGSRDPCLPQRSGRCSDPSDARRKGGNVARRFQPGRAESGKLPHDITVVDDRDAPYLAARW
jgi:hypothetical protein